MPPNGRPYVISGFYSLRRRFSGDGPPAELRERLDAAEHELLVGACGSVEAASPARRLAAHAAIRSAALLAHVDEALAEFAAKPMNAGGGVQGVIVRRTKGGPRVIPLVLERCRLQSALLAALDAVGYERAPAPVRSLRDIIDESDAAAAKRAASDARSDPGVTAPGSNGTAQPGAPGRGENPGSGLAPNGWNRDATLDPSAATDHDATQFHSLPLDSAASATGAERNHVSGEADRDVSGGLADSQVIEPPSGDSVDREGA